MDNRRMFFTERVFGYWNRLPRTVVMALSLLEFGKLLDMYFDFWVVPCRPRSLT